MVRGTDCGINQDFPIEAQVLQQQGNFPAGCLPLNSPVLDELSFS
jgi:hypothetical protein